MSDTVRILRILEYVGEREWAEKQVANSLHGTKTLPKGRITAVTLGSFPEILGSAEALEETELRMEI